MAISIAIDLAKGFDYYRLYDKSFFSKVHGGGAGGGVAIFVGCFPPGL